MSGKCVTFDCYGTLIDWRTGMTAALEEIATGRADLLIEAYHRYEPGLEAATPFINYRTVLTRGLELAATSNGDPLPAGASTAFADTLATWAPFDETQHALAKLHADGWQRVILSNCDRSLLDITVADKLSGLIDDVITSDEVQSYKPGGGMFDEFLRATSPTSGST